MSLDYKKALRPTFGDILTQSIKPCKGFGKAQQSKSSVMNQQVLFLRGAVLELM